MRLWPLGPIPRSETPCVVGLAKDVVGDERRRRFDVPGRDDVHARGRVAEALLGARRRHRHGLEERRRGEHDVELAGVRGRHLLGLLREAARAHDHREIACIGRVDREAAVAAGGHAPLGPRSAAHDDRGAGDHVAGGIVHDARDG